MCHIFYQLFVDLLKIYQSYYLLITVMLENYEKMSLMDKKRAIIIYLNFIQINKEIKKISLVIKEEFKINIEVIFYEIDQKLVDDLKFNLELEEKSLRAKESVFSSNHSPRSSISKDINTDS